MRLALIAAVCLLAAACGPRGPREHQLRQLSKSYAFTIVAQPSPPHARETIQYKIVVRDRETRQPIESGEGQIFANDSSGARTWDGFAKGAEMGTYYGKLNYTTSGQWAVAIRFRRDSLHPLERIDWMQDVYNERPPTTP
jgi:hypothetical protein